MNGSFGPQELVRQLRCAFRAFLVCDMDTRENDLLGRVKAIACDLHTAIACACARGDMVVLHSASSRQALAIVRSVGPLNPDGITFAFSSESGAKRLDHVCTMLTLQAATLASQTETAPCGTVSWATADPERPRALAAVRQ